jgi:N-acetylmuramoyl-L-alanine amidase
MSKYTWILDPGHGGMINGEYQTAGKRSPEWEDGSQYFEGVGNRDIVNRIFEKCVEAGITVFDIVDSEEDIPLSKRVENANFLHSQTKNAIYVSVHSDAFDNPKAHGYSVYTSVGQTKSDKVAEVFIEEMKAMFPGEKLRTDGTDGDQDKEAHFYVLKKTACPAILTENFFYTNPRECELLLSPEGREKIAQAHFNAILKIEEAGI